MTDDRHQAVLDALAALREALRVAQTADAERALSQCERLEQALHHWHAEAIRFAAFTINHIVRSPQADLGAAGDPVRHRVADLRQALDAAGHVF